ncbi:MAG TPA: alpha/beta hydrolase, partial [Caulobacteraceae bacterium]|nr:alpha/beta hydrolase [Caulobacteraceae bacterium]
MRTDPEAANPTMRILSICIAIAATFGLGAAPVPTAAEPTGTCHVGAYRLADGQLVDVGESAGGLRWRRFDGTSGKLVVGAGGWSSTLGWTGRPDGVRVSFGPCGAGTISFDGQAGRRIPLETREASFTSHGVALSGRLLLPPGDGPVPVVVLLQGSETDSAKQFDPLQRLLPAAGVGAFVYDKRGTGASAGVYTQDFSLLADDAVAAMQTARRLAGPRAGRVGFQGPSQGGWVAPLAANRADADFVIVSFGLAVSVLDEDQEAIAFQMGLKRHRPDDIAKALEIGRAAAVLFETGFSQGVEAFEAVRDRYRSEPWYKDVYGNFTHVILGMSAEELRTAGPKFRWGTPFRYDPVPTIAAVEAPQLWILGGQDIDAPAGETARRLEGLMARGRPITLAIYPAAEHGMTEFETAPDGSRLSTRYAEGYFRLMRDFARDGSLCPPYGG